MVGKTERCEECATVFEVESAKDIRGRFCDKCYLYYTKVLDDNNGET